MEIKDKEKQIYAQLRLLQDGEYEDRSFAFDCIGYLTNEAVDDSLELRLLEIEKLITNYLSKKS